MQLWDKCYINFKKINEISFQTTHLEVVLLYLVLLYYEVTLPDIFPLRHIFGGVTTSTQEQRTEWPFEKELKEQEHGSLSELDDGETLASWRERLRLMQKDLLRLRIRMEK
ncbi:hypothetical protein Tco_0553018 [Tanacetum coccineum]